MTMMKTNRVDDCCSYAARAAGGETIAQSCSRYTNGQPIKVVSPDENRVTELAQLSAIEYGRVRETAADHLGIGLGALDKAVGRQRTVLTEQAKREKVFLPVTPWNEPVDGAQLLDEIAGEFRKYCVLPDGAVEALSVWSLFTWVIDAFDIAPILAINSPEKRCGKSTVLNLLQETVKDRLSASNISVASLFRSVDMYHPTLLLDEADAWMRENNELRGIVNAGHMRKSANVIRIEGEDYIPKTFDTFCPKAIAGIGRLPDTISDRAIIVPMRRKLKHEEVARMRADRFDLSILRGKCARWAADSMEELRAADPLVPMELNDRAQDNWRPLMAIADKAGGKWPEIVRAAALQLIDSEQDEATHGMMLLADMQELFVSGQKTVIPSYDLVFSLNQLDERPWSDWNKGAGIRSNNLAKLLKPFGITSKQNRDLHKSNRKSYRLADCEDAFKRYLAADNSALQRYTPEEQGDLRNVTSAESANAALRSATPAESR